MEHISPARKALNAGYFHTQCAAYPHWLLTPLAGALVRMLPRRLASANVRFSMGEMTVVLGKKTAR